MYKRLQVAKMLALVLALTFSVLASAERTAYQLIEGENGTGVWLTAFNADLNSTNPNLVSAIAQNNLITSFTKAEQLTNAHLNVPISQVNLRKTAALIGIDATSVTYNSAWLWGDQVILDLNYQLPSRTVPWRSDYECDSQNKCRLITKPKAQFFELSYYLYANQKIVSKPALQLKPANSKIQEYSLQMASVSSRPTYNKASVSQYSLQWTLFLEKQSSSLSFASAKDLFEFTKGTTKTSYALALREKLNEVTKSQKLEKMLQDPNQPQADYKTPLDRSGKGIFKRSLNANGTQSSSRLVYQEQVYNMITSWRNLNIIASLDLSDRTFIFAQPVIKATDEQPNDYLGAVYVFELEDNKLVLGVSADYVGALMSSDQLLESLRFKSSKK